MRKLNTILSVLLLFICLLHGLMLPILRWVWLLLQATTRLLQTM